MSGETTLLAYTREGLRKHSRGYVTKHHDAFSEGIADLSITLRRYSVNTWVELKACDGWPARAGTRIWWAHYTEQQALFLQQRQGWLFVRVGQKRRTYALFTGATAWRMWCAQGFTHSEFLQEAHRVWFNSVNWDEFVDAIR